MLMDLQCPECGRHGALGCWVTISQDGAVEVELLTQRCLCDPSGAWEDVWEQARDLIREDEKFAYDDDL